MKAKDFSTLLMARPQLAEAMKKDFGLFCRMAWPHLHRGSPLSWTPWHDLICEYLVLVHQKKLLRLIVNCPPRFAKSSIVTILWPIWCWLHNPTLDFLACSYEIDLAVNHNQDRRRLLDSKWFKDHFGDSVKLSTDRSQAGEFSNLHGGTMMAASSNSKAQGRGGDVVICDDLLSADMAFSEVFRSETNSWLTHQLPQRLNNPSESSIVVVAQRLHQNDPCGYLLAQEDSDWFLLKLALVAEEDERWEFPISKRVVIRQKGECLDSKRWSKKVIRQRQQNRLVWAGQFQQEPTDPSGNMIRVDDIQYFGGRDPKTNVLDPVAPAEFDRKILSVDCSFKNRSSSDYVVVLVVGVVASRRYILHVTNAHLDLDGTMNEIRNARNLFGPVSATLVEDAANGTAVIAKLTQEIPGVVAIRPEGGKLARLVAASPEFQARNRYVERNGAWTHKLVEQLTMFPNAKFDDIADSISQCAVWLQGNSYDHNTFIEWMKRSEAGEYDERRKQSRWQRMRRSLGLGGNVNPVLTGHMEPTAPSSCPHCGHTVFNTIGSGASAKFRCTQCLEHCDGDVIMMTDAKDENTCPQCGSQSNIIAGGRRRCISCGHHFRPGVEEPKEELLGCAPGCPAFLKTFAGGRVKCNNCGRYHSPAPAMIGMSRAQYAARGEVFGRGRLGRFG